MAFKALRLADSTTAICSMDPAIDLEATGQEAMADYDKRSTTGGNPSCWRDLVKIKSGETPTEFVIGVIPPDELARILDECLGGTDTKRLRELSWRCFLVGLRDVKGWTPKPDMREVNGVSYVSPDWIKANFIRHLTKVAEDIGSQIFYWNRLTETEAKN